MKEFKGDKRTREYKEWKANFDKESKGLGDTIEKITEATGIKKVVKSLFGDDCGCDERKAKLNKIFNYKNINCLEEDEFKYLKSYFDLKKQRVEVKERRELIKIYNRIFNKNQKDTSCGSCVRNVVNSLKRVYSEYLTK
jgi:NAD(P)H-nitrite reductase large subunit